MVLKRWGSCGFPPCGSDPRRAWGAGLGSKDTRAHPAWPRLTPPDQGLACFILRDPGPWGGGTQGVHGEHLQRLESGSGSSRGLRATLGGMEQGQAPSQPRRPSQETAVYLGEVLGWASSQFLSFASPSGVQGPPGSRGWRGRVGRRGRPGSGALPGAVCEGT